MCQVDGCGFAETLAEDLRPTIVEVHHVVSVSSGGSDSPLNLCVLCANHHAVIHHAPTSAVEHCDQGSIRIRVDGTTLNITRNVEDLWAQIDV